MNIKSWDFAATGDGASQGPITGTVYNGQATLNGTGDISFTAVIEVTNTPGDPNSWVQLMSLTGSGTGSVTDSGSVMASWPYVRARCTALGGTGTIQNLCVSLSAGG
jgi:hypothetical protein